MSCSICCVGVRGICIDHRTMTRSFVECPSFPFRIVSMHNLLRDDLERLADRIQAIIDDLPLDAEVSDAVRQKAQDTLQNAEPAPR